jgi:hypothetical protein
LVSSLSLSFFTGGVCCWLVSVETTGVGGTLEETLEIVISQIL